MCAICLDDLSSNKNLNTFAVMRNIFNNAIAGKVFRIVFFVVLYLSSSAAWAQDSIPKSRTDSVDTLKNAKLLGMVIPTRTSETGWTATGGAIFLFKTDKTDSLLRPSNMFLLVMASQNHQYRFSHGGDVLFPRERWLLSYCFSFSFYTDFFYYIGQQDYRADAEKLTYRIKYGSVALARQVKSHLFVGGLLRMDLIDQLRSDSASVFRRQAPVGSMGYCSYTLSPRLFFDSRDNIMWASKGWYIEPVFQLYNYVADSGKCFYLSGLDVRRFQTFHLPRRMVLSSQFLMQYASQSAAFRFLPNDVGRAWQYNQFRDHLFWTVRNDVRYNLWRGVWLAAFVDASQTAASVSALTASRFRFCAGPGLRLKLSPKDETYLRLDFGFGKDSWNVSFDFANVF